MSKTYLICPDSHAIPTFNNDRADWLGKLIADVRPDVLVHMGDACDLPSLSSYDKGTRGFVGKTYRKDVDAHLDFQERMWAPIKKLKKKLPFSVQLIGNHEFRVHRALDLSPELEGTIGFKDFRFEDYYDVIVPYEGSTPGVIELDGILWAHFFVTGISGRPAGGEHAASTLLSKNNMSSIAAHTHLYDYCTKTGINGKTINSVVVGCYQDYINDWSGNIGKLWRSGITILDNVQDGDFDIKFIRLKTLKDEYG